MKDKIKKAVIITATVIIILGIGGGVAYFLLSGTFISDEYEEEIDLSVPNFTIVPAPQGEESQDDDSPTP